MYKFINFSFSVWQDGDRKACMLYADIPDSKLRYISFYFSEEGFRSFAKEGINSFQDIHHNLRVFFDNCVFYDMEFTNKDHGEMTVPYVNVHFPVFARKILLRVMERVWKMSPEEYKEAFGYNRPKFNVNEKTLKRWARLYGVGSGHSKLVFANDVTEKFFEEKKAESLEKGDDTFMLRIHNLLDIAKNSTSRFWHTKSVVLSKDWDGFFFQVPGMHGGLINHGKDGGKPDWSIHT